MNITRMNLQHYMEDEDSLEDLLDESKHTGRYLKIEPILNRDGVFKRGKECWFEVRGEAFTYDIEMFKFEFGLLDVPSLSLQQVNALQSIVKAKLATKKQKEIYNTIQYNAEDLPRRLDIYKFQKSCGFFDKP